jgi:hypothetical protein
MTCNIADKFSAISWSHEMDQYGGVALSCSETLPLSSVLWLQMQCWNASSLVHLWILLSEECGNLTGILISKAHGLLYMC